MVNITNGLSLRDDMFEGMFDDSDAVLQGLIRNMVEKKSEEGSITIKIDVRLKQDVAPANGNISEARKVTKPEFTHKVGYSMQIKDELKGETLMDGYELVYDEETNMYIMKPIVVGQQMTVYDINPEDVEVVADAQEVPALEGPTYPELPGTVEEVVEESNIVDFPTQIEEETETVTETTETPEEPVQEKEDEPNPFKSEDTEEDLSDEFIDYQEPEE